jgi:tetratricopeptide (TPR) repeat protein
MVEINKNVSELKETIKSTKELIDNAKTAEEKAKFYIDLGNAYILLSEQESPKDNLTNALLSFDQAEKLTDQAEVREIVENMKGFLFFKLAFIEDRNYNLKKSIEHYENALKYRTVEKDPYKYASTKYNLGNSYLSLRDGNERANILTAIKHFEDSYNVRKEQKGSIEFGMIANAIGLSYLMLSELANDEKEALSFLTKAITYFSEAESVFNLTDNPIDYAMINNNLGVCFTRIALLGLDKEKNFKSGIAYYKKALSVYTMDDFPEDYGTTMYNIGLAYFNLSKVVPMPDKAEFLHEAEDYLTKSLEVFSVDQYKDQYARSWYNLGVVYKDLASLYKNKEYTDKEIEAFKNALDALSEENSPFAVATAHFYIAQSLYESGNKTEALAHYEAAKNIAEKFDKKLAADLDSIIKQLKTLE